MMSTFLILLCGFLAAGLVLLLRQKASKWYHWLLALGLYIWFSLGISFVYLNAAGYHHKAVSVGITFFGLVAVIWAVLLARVLQLIGKKKTAGEGDGV
jgi:hypothetical protein